MKEGTRRGGGDGQKIWNNRWFVLVAAMWLQACAGIGYMFGAISPVLKTSLGYNQKQINRLGVAKDIGDSVGLLAGFLCDVLPTWALILLGALQNFLGYGWLWLTVTHRVPPLHFALICVLIGVGTNGESYFNTAALVTCVRNFSDNRGPVVGILKGFAGLSGAIFTLIYTATFAPDQASISFMVAVIPTLVAILVMFVLRHVPSPAAALAGRSSSAENDVTRVQESQNFRFLYGVCLALAAYLLITILMQDIADVSHTVTVAFAYGLLFLLALPLVIPFRAAVMTTESTSSKQTLLEDCKSRKEKRTHNNHSSPPHTDEVLFSELEDEKETWPENERQQRLDRASSRLFRAVAQGAIKLKRRQKAGPRRGEDFTMKQAAVKADFWLLFFSVVCGAGSGLMVIDNLGQISQSLGFANAHIFVSMLSIWNFLGRISGGYVSEIIARDYVFPRPIVMAAAQAGMAIGHVLLAFGCPGSLYAGSLLVGLGYGSHWSVTPATASELFGLKHFGILYNVLTIANPAGSLIFSGLIAGTLYDREAQKQRGLNALAFSSVATEQFVIQNTDEALLCEGAICFQETLFIMTGVCILGIVLNLVLVARTLPVYVTLYGKQRELKDHKFEGSSSTVQKG
ncbi:unnamed protein product [Sphagnum troendelagicum]|uniref:Nodulin-like domain-containing protein n=1 Tax=Sphagnum troendelagicum TaxID=128251 RepID=A0ABP0UKY7_9BRYO